MGRGRWIATWMISHNAMEVLTQYWFGPPTPTLVLMRGAMHGGRMEHACARAVASGVRAIQRRNQFDYFRALPGGLVGLANITQQFHQRGVRVLWGFLSCGAGWYDCCGKLIFWYFLKWRRSQTSTVSYCEYECFAIHLYNVPEFSAAMRPSSQACLMVATEAITHGTKRPGKRDIIGTPWQSSWRQPEVTASKAKFEKWTSRWLTCK